MNLLEMAISLVAPVQCVGCGTEGTALCSGCAVSEIIPYGERCFDCGAISRGSKTCISCYASAPSHVWICTNYEHAARELIKVYKFGHQRAAAKPLANLIVKTMLDFATEEELLDRNYLVIPVPTATSRVRQRGFDHSALLSRRVAHQFNLDQANILLRLGQTRQVGAARSARISQLEGQFLLRRNNRVAGRNILLIDDVVTSGGTLRAATKVLRAAKAKHVDALVFAKRL